MQPEPEGCEQGDASRNALGTFLICTLFSLSTVLYTLYAISPLTLVFYFFTSFIVLVLLVQK